MIPLFSALKNRDAWIYLSIQDIKLRYRRSVLGPFWITISMAIFCVSIGFVYAHLFNTDVSSYLPYLTVSVIIWTFVANSINESANLYVENGVYIKDLNVSPLVLNLRAISRQVVILAHNALVIIVVLLFFGGKISWTLLVSLIALFLLVIFLIPLTACLSLVGARFRDVSQLTINLTQILFFLTPITWESSLLQNREWIFLYNPIYHFIEIVRAPLLARPISLTSWIFCVSAVASLILLQSALFSRKAKRIAFWV